MPRGLMVFLLLLLCTAHLIAQEATLYGTITDPSGEPVPGVNLRINNYPGKGTTSAADGSYRLKIPANEQVMVTFTFIGFGSDTLNVQLGEGEERELPLQLEVATIELQTIEIEDQQVREAAGGIKIDVKAVETIPTPFGNIESALVTQGLGVSSNNELSTTYSVRGGNYDENLVYVNDFEIYRPFLIRSGQQEGLSFINSDLVSSVYFSSGGFQPKYGDKMSSVLDVTYKRPKQIRGSLEFSLLGGSVHLEGSSKNRRFTFLFGLRHKSSQYLLKSLDAKGSYSPAFTDVQGFFTYKASEKVDIELIGNFAFNRYTFQPVDRETTFGVVNQVLRLTIYFEGQEKDVYNTLMSGIGVTHKPNDRLRFKWMGSFYRSSESEAYDILGEYFLGEVETDFGREDFGQVRYSLGVGAIQEYTRNDLEAMVADWSHKGYFIKGKHNLKWGFTYKHEIISDRVNEWELIDSAGYSLPYSGNNRNEVQLFSVLKSKIDLESNRISGYIQDTWRTGDSSKISLTYGARFTYWDLNKEFVVSPRIQVAFRPALKTDVVFRAATGFYNQPPFYRELRDLNANINRSVRAQKSVHVVAGIDLNFLAWKSRKFKFVTEVYYKYMFDLVPYEFDNVLIRYFGKNQSHGYAAGVDFRLHGELVEGADSWLSVSVMSTQEDIEGDSYYKYFDEEGNQAYPGGGVDIVDSSLVYPGSIPRPTDQRVKFALYFQDYFTRNKNFKVHLNMIFASGLPFGPPDNERFRDVLRIPWYKRVDIGFSAQLYNRERKKLPPKNFFKHLSSIWATLEVFNLFGINNTVSYLWIKDFQNTVYAVPNFLTNRRINLRVIFKF